MEVPYSPNRLRTCSKARCNRKLPADYRWKTCERCRQTSRKSKHTQRAAEKAEGSSSAEKESNKRKREDSETSDVEGHEPTHRRRDEVAGWGSQVDDDEDNDIEEHSERGQIFDGPENLFNEIRNNFKLHDDITFRGSYNIALDPLVPYRKRVQLTADEIWKLTGYRFTVRDHIKFHSGHKTRFWCSQDEGRKKKSKQSQNVGVKNRDTTGMKRYPCDSRLIISCREIEDGLTNVNVNLQHHKMHVPYTDVSMPQGATDIVRENVEWLTPVAMVAKVQDAFPEVTAAQIHSAWTQLSQPYWRRDELQLPSAVKLLADLGDDVDAFNPKEVPEGVEILCWGMRKIAAPLKGRCFEVGCDATHNTNSKHLELYSIMAEYDNAGFPSSYCLLSTATAIDQRKRTKALSAWTKCIKEMYGVNPTFVHVDKDMAEIGMAKEVWNAKISLCWWHLRRAVRAHLKNGKLSTTPYNVLRARQEFPFIDPNFKPKGKGDPNEFEGGDHTETGSSQQDAAPSQSGSISLTPVAAPTPLGSTLNTLRVRVPARQRVQALPESLGKGSGKENWIDLSALVKTKTGNRKKLTIRLLPPQKEPANSGIGNAPDCEKNINSDEESDKEELNRRTFCPSRHRDIIVNMMEKHYCAHPLIPGYAPPSPDGIRKWAVRQIYNYCFNNDLAEVWAYLWENWYRWGRWELWARSTHPMIPILKTTMILESHWRRIKHDFLHHFHMPRCDLLVWIIVVKLAPTYYRKLGRLLTETGRYRELPSWRKGFKREWRKLEKTPITMPVNDAYRPDAKKMICTCPYLATSRFLICKHLVQAVHSVPPTFFLEVKRYRETPFWRHPALKPLGESSSEGDIVSGGDGVELVRDMEASMMASQPAGDCSDEGDSEDDNDDEDDDDELIDTGSKSIQTFEESMKEKIDTLRAFADGLQYQVQFRDGRMLQALEREGASLFRMASACLSKERRMQSTRGEVPSTWERSTSSAMFYRSRPARFDSNTPDR